MQAGHSGRVELNWWMRAGFWKARRAGLREKQAEPEDILPAARPEGRETHNWVTSREVTARRLLRETRYLTHT